MGSYLIRQAWIFAWSVLMMAYRNGAAREVQEAVRAAFDLSVSNEDKLKIVLGRLKNALWITGDAAVEVAGDELDRFMQNTTAHATAEMGEGELKRLIEVSVGAEKAKRYVPPDKSQPT